MGHKTPVMAALSVAAGILTISAVCAVVSQRFDALIQYTGVPGSRDHLGAALAFGDVNGDGQPDILVGADAGGSVRGYDGASAALGVARLLFQLNGKASGDGFGTAVTVGPVDGRAVVVVGAPAWDGPAGSNVGYVQGFDAATLLAGGSQAQAQVFELQGQQPTDAFGSALALGDGPSTSGPALLVGAPFADRRGTNYNNGYVTLFNVATLLAGGTQTEAQRHRWDGAEHYDEMGRSVAFGDVNGDGTLDLILGAGSGNGADYGGYVMVVDGETLTQELGHFTDGLVHVKPEQNFGFAVAVADVTGDGWADVIIGAYRGRSAPVRNAPATGYVRVYSYTPGTPASLPTPADWTLRYQVNGVANGDQFGRAVAAVPVTGQVWRNVLVGARWGANGGYVRVFDGPTGALLDEQGADAPFDWFGHTVAASDVGLDGLATFGVGAYQGDTRSVSQAGYIYIFKEQ